MFTAICYFDYFNIGAYELLLVVNGWRQFLLVLMGIDTPRYVILLYVWELESLTFANCYFEYFPFCIFEQICKLQLVIC